MIIKIEINGRKAVINSGNHEEEMKTAFLMKEFKLNDLYQYLKMKNEGNY